MLPRHARRRHRRRQGRRAVVPGVSRGSAVGHHRSVAAGRVLRPALRPGRRTRRCHVFARDEAGNESTAPIDRQTVPKASSSRSRDRPPLPRPRRPGHRSNTPRRLTVDAGDDLLPEFLAINGELRRKNDQRSPRSRPRPRPRCCGARSFTQFGNTAVESRFADHRTYFYNGKEVDQQTHLGFDLASLQQAPVAAANRGMVVYADYLGIYGNCVIIDHGLGVQSLYAHLSSIGRQGGRRRREGPVARPHGMTGLAGGDHLHFTMLVNGVQVNPVEWWDPHWMEDRVFRKIREAGGNPPAPAAGSR